MKKAKRYEIETLQQIVNIVNDENIECLILDFAMWLQHTHETFKRIKARNPDLKTKLNSEIAKAKFIWNDDGKNELKIARTINTSTGEVIETKPRKSSIKKEITQSPENEVR